MINPLASSIINNQCREPVEGLANAHVRVPTLYEWLLKTGLKSAVNFNHYWRGTTRHFAPELAELGIYLCAYQNNPDLLEPLFDCPEGLGKKQDFAGYDVLGLSRLTDALEQGDAYDLLTFYFAGVDGYCHHMYEERAPFDVKACQAEYVKQCLDGQFFAIVNALTSLDPSWRDHTLVVLTADHGMTTANLVGFDIKARVADALAKVYCIGDCDDNPRDREIVLADNGGIAHIYVRNQQTHEWGDVPQWDDILKVAVASASDEQIRSAAFWILTRDVQSGKEWDSQYKRFDYNPKTKRWRLSPLPKGRTTELIQNLRSIRSGDLVVVLGLGLYFDDPDKIPGEPWWVRT